MAVFYAPLPHALDPPDDRSCKIRFVVVENITSGYVTSTPFSLGFPSILYASRIFTLRTQDTVFRFCYFADTE